MKTKLFKFGMPAAAIVFAVASAFTTIPQSNAGSADSINGYADSPNPCSVPISCSTTNNGVLCMDGNQQQVYGKFNPGDTTCPRVVYRP